MNDLVIVQYEFAKYDKSLSINGRSFPYSLTICLSVDCYSISFVNRLRTTVTNSWSIIVGEWKSFINYGTRVVFCCKCHRFFSNARSFCVFEEGHRKTSMKSRMNGALLCSKCKCKYKWNTERSCIVKHAKGAKDIIIYTGIFPIERTFRQCTAGWEMKRKTHCMRMQQRDQNEKKNNRNEIEKK